ncbi:surface antigen BspA-like [Trichomonas vaginalis G3]|uniref:receptor protein-tyrosine kinase n=1 Tax=Trichomonas vaginalis (strain ATCC PRA-98 / G3) TaxID=412133 RepID=A2EB57_TRIV3|nr:protein kinase a regulatory subunit binding [Trichomonas vaginalis G3]EAY10103.1 surface antigen BspA-like [Trichomonas vaginalis G3]KAI5531522.1 protein kinase a regulatory subunit binding [Trichomonas vaginalis G3]|eukprot:XP_001322326.1 surface antigen BspA-like [Trichomonas vaginalis G3]
MLYYFVFALFEAKYDFKYTGRPESQKLTPGLYKLEVWGAQGGGYSSNSDNCGGKGGYSIGYLALSQETTLFVRVGGMGKAPNDYYKAEGGSNGGGFAYGGSNRYDSTIHQPGYSGGGETDIRVIADSISYRIIVAEGGGGAGTGYKTSGGYGGGLRGGGSYGAGQDDQRSNSYSSNEYRFQQFYGGNTSDYGCIGAGGGGWYGGGTLIVSGHAYDRPSSGGSGGSGYVYTSSTQSQHPNGYNIGSKYYLTSAQTIDGSQDITNPDGTKTTGHAGDGYARITYIDYINYTSNGYSSFVEGLVSPDCPISVEIKSTFLDKSVTSILGQAFKNNQCINEVIIPSTISSIGSQAFEGCINLVNVTFLSHTSLSTIDREAFKGCTKLQRINDFSSLKTLADNVFQDCTSLQQIINMPQVTTFNKYCFQGCTSLEQIGDLPQVTSIDKYCFLRCVSLKKIGEMPKIKTLPISCFEGCTSLQQIGDILSTKYNNPIVNFSCCFDLTSLPDNAFKDCHSLKEVIFPPTLTTVGPSCFANCLTLKFADFPPKTTTIGEGCFSGCTTIDYIYIPSSITIISPFIFCSCGIKSLTINSRSTVYGNAFVNCTNLSRIEIFDEAVIMPDAFALCDNIKDIAIYEHVTLYVNAFSSIHPTVYYFGTTNQCPRQTEFELHRLNDTQILVSPDYFSDKYASIKAIRIKSYSFSPTENQLAVRCSKVPYYNDIRRVAFRAFSVNIMRVL